MSLGDSYELVREFHRTFSLPLASKPAPLSSERKSSRCEWLLEEVRELINAESIEDQADALLDIIYLALGGFAELGTDPSHLFKIIHSSNMSKLWPDKRPRISENGKVAKPPNWQDPRQLIGREVRRQLGM